MDLQGKSGGAVLNPATGLAIGSVPHASVSDLDRALDSAQRGFDVWRKISAFDRYKLMRRAAEKLRERVDEISRVLTLEQGKPQAEAKLEVLLGADIIDWFAEEARRSYGRVIPSRSGAVQQTVIKEPVGPVAAFTPWNFPINQAVRKISAAIATGCSVILKGPEETPASCAALVQAYADAGLPSGVLNLVVRRAGRSVVLPDNPSLYSQNLLYRLDPDRKATRCSSRRSHEACHDGAWRTCTGVSVQRCGCEGIRKTLVRSKVQKCRSGLRFAHALHRT